MSKTEPKSESDDQIVAWIEDYKIKHLQEWKEIEEIIRLCRELGLRGYMLSGTIDEPAFFSVDVAVSQ